VDGINLISLQDEIYNHVVAEFLNYEIVQDVVLTDEYILKIDNKVKPFVVLQWGGLQRDGANASFAGVRHDSYYSTFNVVAIGPNPRIAKRVSNMFMDRLIGYKTSQGSELTPVGRAVDFAVSDSNSVPHLYLAVNSLSFRFNSTNPDANITP